MKEVPYDKWCDFIEKKLKKYGIDDGLICDLGCGSGTLTTMLSDRGYDMTGIDSSNEMLQEALAKKGKRDILYLGQDIREFELYGTMRAIVSSCDALNYIISKNELKKVFRLAANYLDPAGLFIFDIHTSAYYEKLGNNTFSDTTERSAYIWDNSYDRSTGINEYELTLFTENPDGSYTRSEEEHMERAYSGVYINKILKGSGFEILEIKADYTERNIDDDHDPTDRVVYITRKLN
ncbi:MAG: methyltransferase domain-containing protein [Lachnospiraceae bacterium]|nr:methyltransferase domain-containing protein [Lachnospiraceae bacterium]